MSDAVRMAYDIVIVGGGLSGLALAAELAQAEFSTLRVLMLEQREHCVRDRTWSYWKTPHSAAHRYSHLERQQWSQWCVRQGVRVHRQASPPATKDAKDAQGACYCTLDADAFYSAAQRAISQNAHVALRLGTSVQQFAGYEIKTDRDVFDPASVELMHFQPSTDGLLFFYVLPYGPRNALVESTWISPASLKPDFAAQFQQFIASIAGSAAYEMVYQEKGALNLGVRPATPNQALHVARLGRAAGTLRASTGYAFLETLGHAAQIAASLKSYASTGKLNHWVPAEFRRRALGEWMDRIFMAVLQRDWGASSRYFMQLFERLDADTMVAFLSGRASWRQRPSVAGALPALPFVAQALSAGIDRAPGFPGARC